MKYEIDTRDIIKALENYYQFEEGAIKELNHIEGERWEIKC